MKSDQNRFEDLVREKADTETKCIEKMIETRQDLRILIVKHEDDRKEFRQALKDSMDRQITTSEVQHTTVMDAIKDVDKKRSQDKKDVNDRIDKIVKITCWLVGIFFVILGLVASFGGLLLKFIEVIS